MLRRLPSPGNAGTRAARHLFQPAAGRRGTGPRVRRYACHRV